MRYFHSNKNFNHYKPPEPLLSKLKKIGKKREIKQINDGSAFNNPFKKQEKKSIKPKIVGGTLVTTLLIWAYVMLNIPYFQVRNIIIYGNKITDAKEVKDFVLNTDFFIKKDGFGHKNYFLIPDFKISQEVKNYFLYENVSITKIFPDTIKIDVIEKRAVVIYDNGKIIKLLNIDGKDVKNIEKKENQQVNIFKANENEITSSTISEKPIENNENQYLDIKNQFGFMPIIIGERNEDLSNKSIQNILDWQKTLNTQSDLNIKYFIIGDNEHKLKIVVDKPWYIIVDQTSSINAQLKNLKIITANNQPTEYVDLRFGERVYWK